MTCSRTGVPSENISIPPPYWATFEEIKVVFSVGALPVMTPSPAPYSLSFSLMIAFSIYTEHSFPTVTPPPKRALLPDTTRSFIRTEAPSSIIIPPPMPLLEFNELLVKETLSSVARVEFPSMKIPPPRAD